MDEASAWFRWIIGGVLAIYGAASGWFAHILLGNRDKIAALKERIAVLENRPHVDPIDYATAMTNLTNAITALTLRLTEYQQVSQQQYAERTKAHEKVEGQLEVMTEELLAIKVALNGYMKGHAR